VIVADVNLLVYLLVPGEHTRGAEQARERDPEWYVPAGFDAEFLNVLCSLVRFRRMSLEQASVLLRRSTTMVIRSQPAASEDLLAAAVAANLTTYDTEYVLLAREKRLRLVTSDKQVLAAATDVAVSIRDFAEGK
jgi:predicted nucleic acid-binding protein